MMDFDIDFFNTLDFSGSVIDRFGNTENDVWFGGDFSFGEIPYFGFTFKNCTQKRGEYNKDKIVGAKITHFEITKNDLYGVSVSFDNGITLDFSCEWIYRDLEMYKGKSYKNVYPEWQKHLGKYDYVESAEYFVDEEDIELPEGYSLNVKLYSDSDEHVRKAVLEVCELTKNGEHVFSYRCTYNHAGAFKEPVYHSNGHKYLPFQIDLYGISYLDLDSGEVYHYIPEGYSHDIDRYYGESFIITDIHYDPQTDLVAYGGCYWAFPYEVMVGDLTEPLNYDPHLISVREILDPENEECLDYDFVRFEDGKLIVKNDDNQEFSIDLAEIKAKIKALSE